MEFNNFPLLRRERESFMGDYLEQPLFNVWTRGATQLALLLDEGIASSSVQILHYIYLASSLIFFYFAVVDCQSKPVTLRALPMPPCFNQDRHPSRVRQFFLVSHLCLYCFSFFFLFFYFICCSVKLFCFESSST